MSQPHDTPGEVAPACIRLTICGILESMTNTHEAWRAAFAAELRAEVGAQDVAWSALAERVGISEGAMSNYKAGRRDIPLPTWALIADALGVPVDEFTRRALRRM